MFTFFSFFLAKPKPDEPKPEDPNLKKFQADASNHCTMIDKVLQAAGSHVGHCQKLHEAIAHFAALQTNSNAQITLKNAGKDLERATVFGNDVISSVQAARKSKNDALAATMADQAKQHAQSAETSLHSAQQRLKGLESTKQLLQSALARELDSYVQYAAGNAVKEVAGACTTEAFRALNLKPTDRELRELQLIAEQSHAGSMAAADLAVKGKNYAAHQTTADGPSIQKHIDFVLSSQKAAISQAVLEDVSQEIRKKIDDEKKAQLQTELGNYRKMAASEVVNAENALERITGALEQSKHFAGTLHQSKLVFYLV